MSDKWQADWCRGRSEQMVAQDGTMSRLVSGHTPCACCDVNRKRLLSCIKVKRTVTWNPNVIVFAWHCLCASELTNYECNCQLASDQLTSRTTMNYLYLLVIYLVWPMWISLLNGCNIVLCDTSIWWHQESEYCILTFSFDMLRILPANNLANNNNANRKLSATFL